MGELLSQSPLVEAYCNFNFSSGSTIDMTVPGDFYNNIKEEFPSKNSISGFQRQKLGTSNVVLEYGHPSASQILQCFHREIPLVAQLGINLLSINHRLPYSKWETFSKLIHYTYENYREVANPKSIQSIALHYRNIIDIDNLTFKSYNEHFALGANIPEELNLTTPTSINTHYECSFEEINSLITVKIVTIKNPQDFNYKTPVLFEIGINNKEEIKDLDSLGHWLEPAHNKIEDIFFGSITDHCKNKYR